MKYPRNYVVKAIFIDGKRSQIKLCPHKPISNPKVAVMVIDHWGSNITSKLIGWKYDRYERSNTIG